jgi:hypothetical protein
MTDEKVTDHINGLAGEEHELLERQERGLATDRERARLRHIEVMLDRCWDLLRQRRARREFGLNPEDAHVRDEKTVKRYIG